MRMAVFAPVVLNTLHHPCQVSTYFDKTKKFLINLFNVIDIILSVILRHTKYDFTLSKHLLKALDRK